MFLPKILKAERPSQDSPPLSRRSIPGNNSKVDLPQRSEHTLDPECAIVSYDVVTEAVVFVHSFSSGPRTGLMPRLVP